MTEVRPFDYSNQALYGGAFQKPTETKKAEGDAPARRASFRLLLQKSAESGGLDAVEAQDLPISAETETLLFDEVHISGDALKKRPFPEEIVQYKNAVRRLMRYVVENALDVENSVGIPNSQKPGFKGNLLERRKSKGYASIEVIDKKLEKLAADLMTAQMEQITLLKRIDEINGLLVDLLQ